MKLRQDLSAPGLWKTARNYFKEEVTDSRKEGGENKRDFSLVDCLMSGGALFSLKFPSLLQFDQQSRNNDNIRHNLNSLFGIQQAPSDTQLRGILDPINPRQVRGVFKAIFSAIQRGKLLEEFVFFKDSYLLALDGTGYFSSPNVFCENCCQKQYSNGTVTYYHQMLSGVLIHPDKKAVIPFAPEPIVQQDGTQKNDCERNAAERFLRDFRREHPHLKVIVTEDGLSSNAPHIRTLKELQMSFVLGCKPGDHKALFEFVEGSEKLGAMEKAEIWDGKTLHRFRWINQVALNDSNPECLVNFLEYWEIKGEKITHWSWVSDLELEKDTVYRVMRAGRARWAIENETFNSLKNNEYSFEHNFGHGDKNLSVNFALLMMLAFLIDQVQQIACQFFQKARQRIGTQREHWRTMRFFFEYFTFKDWEEFLSALAYGIKTEYKIQVDSS